MFKTTIDGKEVKVVFSHQRAMYEGQLTRPDIRWKEGHIQTVRIPVYAITFCFFGDTCVGMGWCSYADQSRYSKEVGRQAALRNALACTLKRAGKKDRDVARERGQVWEDYFRAGSRRNKTNPLVIGRAIHRLAKAGLVTPGYIVPVWRNEFAPPDSIHWKVPEPSETGMLTDPLVPLPRDSDAPDPQLPWELGGQGMPDHIIHHLNEREED